MDKISSKFNIIYIHTLLQGEENGLEMFDCPITRNSTAVPSKVFFQLSSVRGLYSSKTLHSLTLLKLYKVVIHKLKC